MSDPRLDANRQVVRGFVTTIDQRQVERLHECMADDVVDHNVVVHRGRRPGRRYRTPVNVFATEDGYRFALTYGPDTDWVRSVLAAGGCEQQTRGRTGRRVPGPTHASRKEPRCASSR
jgi:hypothetical protein